MFFFITDTLTGLNSKLLHDSTYRSSASSNKENPLGTPCIVNHFSFFQLLLLVYLFSGSSIFSQFDSDVPFCLFPILLGVYEVSWTWRYMPFTKAGKFQPLFLWIFLLTHSLSLLSFWDSKNTYLREFF